MQSHENTANEELRARIAHHALERFIAEGYSRVRTDDLAAELGISKKTIYRVFRDKKDLLQEAVRRHTDRVEQDLVEKFDNDPGGFPEKVSVLFGIVERYIVPIQSIFVADLLRSAPEVWQRIEEYRREHVLSRLEGLIRRGIEEGYLRPDLRPDIFVGLLAQFVQKVVTPQTIMSFGVSFADLFQFVRTVFFVGSLTDSGRAVWEAFDENQ